MRFEWGSNTAAKIVMCNATNFQFREFKDVDHEIDEDEVRMINDK